MSELATSFAEPAYVARLALRCAPFSTAVDNTMYYSGGQLEHRLNLLLHLVRASDKVGLMIADHGFGKTTLLAQLALRAGDALKVCMINAKSHLTTDTILVKCLTDLGVEQNDIDANLNHSDIFQNRLKQLRKLNIRPVLVIDDAQHLSASVLNEISQWLSWQDNSQYLLQAIIASTHVLDLPEVVRSRLQPIDLPPLNQDEVEAYVTDRLSKAGYIGEAVFTAQELLRFHKRSRGNPALVNQLAHQKLLGIKSGLADITKFKFVSIVNLRWLGVAIVIIFFGLLLINQEKVNSFFKLDAAKQDISQDIIVPEPEDDIATINIEQDQVISHQQAMRNELVELVEQLPTPSQDESALPEVIETPQTDTNTLAENKLISEATELKEIMPVEVEQDPLPDLHREPWILQQQGTNYTFQLMGSWQQQEVYDFVLKYALTGDIAMLESSRNGKSWYALIYGVFDTKEAALKASKQWPAPLNTLPSWLRRFDSVQKQIKGAEQSR